MGDRSRLQSNQVTDADGASGVDEVSAFLIEDVGFYVWSNESRG